MVEDKSCSKMGISILVNGMRMVRWMKKERLFLRMGISIRDSLRMIRSMVMERWNMKMEIGI